MKVRFRIPGLGTAALHALERKARLILGRHAAAIDAVEVSLHERERDLVHHADCELTVTMRDGSTIRVVDDENQVHRALMRAAWRIDQRHQVARVREGPGSGARRSAF